VGARNVRAAVTATWPHDAAADFLLRCGLNGTTVEFVGVGHCGGYRIPEHRIFIRVGRPGTEVQSMRAVEFGRRLQGMAPVISPLNLSSIEQPIRCAGAPVTVWPLLPIVERPVNFRLFGETLRALHDLSKEDAGIDFPISRTPIAVAQSRVSRFATAPMADRVSLADIDDVYREIDVTLDDLSPDLPRRVVHGDAYPENFVSVVGGGAVLIDYDSAGLGPTYWDLAPVEVLHRRFGLESAAANAFFDGYGSERDPRDDERFWQIVRARELGVITAILDRAGHDPDWAEELRRRLATRFDAATNWTRP
jgi:Phosphotransferase enzyme family